MTPAWWRFARREDELSEEMASHLAMAIRERVARGEPLASATEAARREFGNREVVRATTRDVWGWHWLETLALDFRYALRKLRRAPGFTAVAAVSLALGIGATVTMYAVVDAADIRGLPYPDADRLVAMEETGSAQIGGGAVREFGAGVSAATFTAWRQSSRAFDAMTLVSDRDLFLTENDELERLQLSEVGVEFFPMLGAVPSIGRGIVPGDTLADAPGVAVLSRSFWLLRFHGDRNVIGKSLDLTRTEDVTAPHERFTIIGVMPERIDYPGAAQGWIAARSGPAPTGAAGGISHAVARLRKGWTIASARAELNAIEHGLAPANTGPFPSTGVRVQSLRARLRAGSPNDPVAMDSARGRLVRLAAVVVVLLIAMINVGNLLLARSAYRDHEVAVRVALGASRRRLAQQLLVEGACIALAGGSIGVAFAMWGTRITASLGDLARMGIVPTVDGRVLLFAVSLSVVVALGVGFIPVMSLIRAPRDSRRDEPTRTGAGRTRAMISGILLAGQIGAALTLLTGAGLLAKELLRLHSKGYGYDTKNMVLFPVNMLRGSSAERAAFRDEAVAHMRRVPGVVSASFLEQCNCPGFFPAGARTKMVEPGFFLQVVGVNQGFLRNLRIPLLRGRDFTDADYAASTPVGIVSAATAERFWPGEDPIGKEVVVAPGMVPRGEPKPDSAHVTVVGVMGNPNFLAQPRSPPVTLIRPPTASNGFDVYFVRVNEDSAATVAALRHTFTTLRGKPLTRGSYLPAQVLIDRSLAEQRLTTRALLAFAAVALLLATLGVHGLVAFSVAQRTREIGIRMALGAESGNVLLLVTRHGLVLAAAGIALGLAGSLGSTRVLGAMLYGTSPTDPLVFAGSALLLATVVLVASYLPARHATRVDPMVALRVD